MFSDFTVPIPDAKGKIIIKRKKPHYIEYEYDRIYIKEKKYTLAKRTTIGKQHPENPSLMYPNSNYLKYFGSEAPVSVFSDGSRSRCLKTGAFIIIEKILKDYGLPGMISKYVGEKYDLFMDLVAYSIITEDNAAQYYPDYAFNHPLFTKNMHIYSDSTVSSFLSDMTIDMSVAFLNEWNKTRDHREKIYISYDSTNKQCQAGDIEIAEIGHSKEGSKDKPVINYSIAYDSENSEPLFYEDYCGSVVDVSQLQYMLERTKAYGYKRIGFILDRGYFSEENIRFMDNNSYDFIIMMKGMKRLASEVIMEVHGTFEKNRSHRITEYGVSGITVKRRLFQSDEDERYFHVYYNDWKSASERETLEKKLDKLKRFLKNAMGQPMVIPDSIEHYYHPIYWHKGQPDQKFMHAVEKDEVITKETKLCGYFIIITSKNMTAREALLLYKSRDASEKLFRGDKSYLGNKSYRTHKYENSLLEL